MAGPKVIKSLERGLLVLQALQMQPDSSLQELYVFTGISKPSLLRILHTLAITGLVTRRLADGRYRIGATFSRVPSRREHRDRIAEAAAPILERLCQRVSWPSDLMVPAGDHMEIRETSRARSPILLQGERVGLPVNWLLSGVGRAYLAYCPAKERQRIIDMLRSSGKAEDRLARESARLNAILAEVRARGYATRDPIHVGGYYGGPPHADGLFSIAVPLRDGPQVLGAINMLWLKTAFSVEDFASRRLQPRANMRNSARLPLYLAAGRVRSNPPIIVVPWRSQTRHSHLVGLRSVISTSNTAPTASLAPTATGGWHPFDLR